MVSGSYLGGGGGEGGRGVRVYISIVSEEGRREKMMHFITV